MRAYVLRETGAALHEGSLAVRLADEGKRLLGCNYGSCVPHVDFPRLARLFLRGQLPLERLIGERAPLAAVDRALCNLRAGAGLRTILEPQAA